MQTLLKNGDKAPAFELTDQHGQTVKLDDFKGRKLLIYFYPRALTPGCTTQSCSVRDAKNELAEQGVSVLGVSPDPAERQLRFAGKYRLDFPLLCDTGHKTAEAYGVWAAKKFFGHEVIGMIVRSAFLIDENGNIIKSWYKVKPKDTVPGVDAALAEL